MIINDINSKGITYFKVENEKLKPIPFLDYVALPRPEKEAVLTKLESLPREVKVLQIRNAIYYSLHPGNLPELPGDLLKLIFAKTTPRDIENARVNKHWTRWANHSAMILSINQGRKLDWVFKTAQRAIEWLKKDLNACAQLRFAYFSIYEDLTNENLKDLFEICPNLIHLHISSELITEIPNLPQSLQYLSIVQCPSLKTLPPLPSGLQGLRCIHCQLTSLPSLPVSLKKIYFNNCSFTNLPTLPTDLQELMFIQCYSAKDLPALPQTLRSLWCIDCSLFTTLPKLPEGLQKLNFQNCHAFTSVPKLPKSLQEIYGFFDYLDMKSTKRVAKCMIRLGQELPTWHKEKIDRALGK